MFLIGLRVSVRVLFLGSGGGGGVGALRQRGAADGAMTTVASPEFPFSDAERGPQPKFVLFHC